MENIVKYLKLYDKIKSDLLHGGYNGKYLEETCIEELSTKIANEQNLSKDKIQELIRLGIMINVKNIK